MAINWKGAKGTFEGDGNFCILVCVVVTRLYRYIKIHQAVRLKFV